MNFRALLLCTAAFVLAPAWAVAQQQVPPNPADEAGLAPETDDSEQPDDGLAASYRIWGESADSPEFASDDPQHMAIRQYLRGRIELGADPVRFTAEADILAGQLAGDAEPALPDRAQTGTRAGADPLQTERIVEPREFYAQWMTDVGQLSAGLQTSQWGLGLLAHSGAADDEGLFNQHFGGDRVLRGVFATAPLRPLSDSALAHDLYVAVGGDLVWRDENADFIAGDRAWQGMAALLYDGEDTRGGTYIVYRNQTDRNDDVLEVLAFDLYADHSFVVADDWQFRAAAEAALMSGETDRTWTTDEAEPVSVLGLGAASELEARYEPLATALQLRAGYASGDANADDDTLYRFRFDPNYKVGLVLFDHYLPAVTRTSVASIDDPTRSGQPPKGVDGLISDGGVENAYYVSPALLYGDKDSVLGGVSLLWARADQPVLDPYLTFESGGTPTGLRGRRPASRELGVEVDAALQYRFEPVERLTLEMKAEYGIFFPGEAFDDADGNADAPQSLARLRMALLW
jgi:hypothetical protein